MTETAQVPEGAEMGMSEEAFDEFSDPDVVLLVRTPEPEYLTEPVDQEWLKSGPVSEGDTDTGQAGYADTPAHTPPNTPRDSARRGRAPVDWDQITAAIDQSIAWGEQKAQEKEERRLRDLARRDQATARAPIYRPAPRRPDDPPPPPQTTEQLLREGKQALEAERTAAKRRQRLHAGTAPGRRSCGPSVTRSGGEAAKIVASRLGMSEQKFRRGLEVIDRIDLFLASEQYEQVRRLRTVLEEETVQTAWLMVRAQTPDRPTTAKNSPPPAPARPVLSEDEVKDLVDGDDEDSPVRIDPLRRVRAAVSAFREQPLSLRSRAKAP